ncbi:serine/threonine-protein kinase [Synoicihabitans lomoniglobus]|uniref:Serine/threonine-protein kinase n=1 Tax=Synoicihabitans lomoniglobus TaxID=2909285 RepID=A0AAE9ZV04_9BACT|nr:serine/threonine protein kinase [Opitutaceae bacterium LMO-M01]WED64681.1 serine/threonine-protein kinase [Opitutaceae bacterium LMO-M01]
MPTHAREAFLLETCGNDDALRARVEALIAGYEAADSFLEDSPIERPLLPPEEKIGDVIGRYALQRRIGDGGCGVVYLAEQKEPVRRHVALKVIKLGMDTNAVIARFTAERQALAMMDHPDIARVFDAGTTEAGRPFFVMEYVDGVRITEFCDEHNLSLHERLELFARVCLAIQHAHQKGIIHRDVKPSNILVARSDGVPTPKVIDFGIAKATQGRLTEETLLTGVGQFMGTPAYMSPEQAELRDFDIDTRSDVYSLGVLLYEMLTGQPPFDPQELVRGGIDEVRRVIREVDPPRPSARIAALSADACKAIAQTRRVPPPHLRNALRGDLDAIVMRCLEKPRTRRYGTAQELADDVRRHLRHEPVEARPQSTAYRIQKFVARNQLACLSVAAITATLVGGTIVSVRQAVRATAAEQTATAERDAATAAGRAEALARADAQRRQEQAEDLLTFMLGDFRTELQKIGRLNLLDAVGEKAMDYFAGLNARDLTDTALVRQSKALTQIGETRIDQARYPEAAAAFTTAYDRAAALCERHPSNADMLFERAQAEFWIGFVARRRGEFAEEREWLMRYRDSAIALNEIEGKTLRSQNELTYGYHNLAVLDFEAGDLKAARAGFLSERHAIAELLAANPGDLELQTRMTDIASWLGSVAERDGAYLEAVERYTEMSSGIETLMAREPDVVLWQERLAASVTFTGNLQAMTAQPDRAMASYDRAMQLLDALVARDPHNQRWLVVSLNLQLQRITLLLAAGETDTAHELLPPVREQLEALVAAEPGSHEFTRRLATAWRLEARLQMATQPPDARAAIDRAIALGNGLIQQDRANSWAVGEFAQAQLLAGRIAHASGDDAKARQHWQEAIGILGSRWENSHDWRFLDPAAQALVLTGETARARPLLERLARFGYHATDPLAASTLDIVSPPQGTNPNPR